SAHQLSHSIVTAGSEPEKMGIMALLLKIRKEVGHFFGQVPAVERAAVDERKPIAELEFGAASRSLFFAEFEERKVHATRDHLVMHRSPAQSFPFTDDGPDFFRQRYDGVSRSKDAALSRFGETIRKTALSPVFGVDILLRHQAAQIKYHLRAETPF